VNLPKEAFRKSFTKKKAFGKSFFADLFSLFEDKVKKERSFEKTRNKYSMCGTKKKGSC